ncbi:hypothetical protein EVAR_79330_1 [Eumeta japonica]|uniref:Uncharacterized protein n=1 Tax=Eumeta variegata TaxID=151549 RepID=A0A4C1THU3_EUMVA|nr:hypothetical protein EVAR_79330_1 [Eumeta japonica]
MNFGNNITQERASENKVKTLAGAGHLERGVRRLSSRTNWLFFKLSRRIQSGNTEPAHRLIHRQLRAAEFQNRFPGPAPRSAATRPVATLIDCRSTVSSRFARVTGVTSPYKLVSYATRFNCRTDQLDTQKSSEAIERSERVRRPPPAGGVRIEFKVDPNKTSQVAMEVYCFNAGRGIGYRRRRREYVRE